MDATLEAPPPRRLVVLGATGATGTPLVRQALERGHTVTAVVRGESSKAHVYGGELHDNLTVVVGDVFSAASLGPTFKGHDAVISVLGFPKKQPGCKMEDFTASMAAILPAMAAAEIHRIVTISAWFTTPERETQSRYTEGWVNLPGLTETLDNEGEMEKLLAQTAADATAGTAIAFTSIRPPSLTWDPGSGKTVLEREGAGWVDGASGLMAREDVARAILNTLDDDERSRGNAWRSVWRRRKRRTWQLCLGCGGRWSASGGWSRPTCRISGSSRRS